MKNSVGQNTAGYIEALTKLRKSYASGKLTLYLGAGVSLGSGLPNWSTLVATLYYSAIMADWTEKWTPYPNYLFALAEWLLRQSGEPPEVIAGKIESYYRNNSEDKGKEFENAFLNILYSPWKKEAKIQSPSGGDLRSKNRLLDAAAKLCEATDDRKGLYAVVTTNYDCLLEKALENGPAAKQFLPAWKSPNFSEGHGYAGSGTKSIFHVHGYLPPPDSSMGPGSSFEEIMLTEAHYHAAASDLYSWSNLCMVRCFSASVGLIVGMSMTDRNLRRLLHALKRTRLLDEVYLVLRAPSSPPMRDCDADQIHQNAQHYADRFPDSGISLPYEIKPALDDMLEQLKAQEKDIIQISMADLGVKIIWVDQHSDVAEFLERILT